MNNIKKNLKKKFWINSVLNGNEEKNSKKQPASMLKPIVLACPMKRIFAQNKKNIVRKEKGKEKSVTFALMNSL